MTKQILLPALLLFLFHAHAQVVFCPQGASWHYAFIPNNMSPEFRAENVSIAYERDSIVDGEQVKVLSPTRFFMQFNLNRHYTVLLRQHGDTIHIRGHRTNHKWEVYINFAAKPGDSWETNILEKTPAKYSYTVSSVETVTINGQLLKRLHIGDTYVTERLGWKTYMFPYRGRIISDGDYFYANLCYSDATAGTFINGSLPCDYAVTSLHENIVPHTVRIYPNPASESITIDSVTETAKTVQLYDLTGRMLQQHQLTTGKLDVSGVPQGIYLLKINDHDFTHQQLFLKN